MTVLERLDQVKQKMRDLGRELELPNRIFDVDEVNRKVRDRLEQVGLEARSGRGLSASGK
jgi:hypothetical protein